MEEQTAQSYETFENRNQNSVCLLPGKIDLMDPSDNGLLSYGDNEEDGNGDTADLLMPEKQFSEISSATDMTTSTSQDTGFGSATVSEMPSPVENNDTVTKPLRSNAASRAEDESYDSASDDTTNEIEILPNDKARGEKDVITAHKGVEDKNSEKLTIDTIQGETVELAAQKKEEDIKTFSDDKADENIVKKTHIRTEYKRIENIEQQETEDEGVEKTSQQETEDESVKKTAYEEASCENVQHSVAEDENSIHLVNNKTEEEHSENVVQKEITAENEAIYKVENVNIETTANAISDNEFVENVEHEVQNAENAETDVPENKQIMNVEQTAAHYDGNEAHKPENICPAGEDNTEITASEGRDVGNVSFYKAFEESVSIGNCHLEKFDNAVKEQSKVVGDNDVENAKSNKPDEHVENGAIDKIGKENVEILTSTQTSDEIVRNVIVDKTDDQFVENGTSNSSEDDNTQRDVCQKTDNKNLQNAEGDKADEKSTDEEKENVMDILGNGLLKKKVLVPGKGTHTRPTNGEIVTVKVDGQLPDGTHVDTGEITFCLNDGDVIIAFDLAVALMEDGEKCELFTSERYAYGSLGRDPDIPKDTSITYVLELVNVQKPPDVSEMNFDQRLKMGEAKRERGNYLFGRTDYSGAINSYNRAVKLLDNPELNEGIDENCHCIVTESWVKCYNNLAASQLKIDALDAAIKSCERVLSVQEDNVKALFRLGKAYGSKGEVDQALIYLRRAVKLDPESKLMQQEMLNLTRRKNKETATEKELYQRMLGVKPGGKPSMTEEENKRSNSNKLIKWTLVAGGVAAVLISVGLSWYRAS